VLEVNVAGSASNPHAFDGSRLDSVIHQPVRLRLMAALTAVAPRDQVEFTYLRDLLKLTDGNLSAHLLKLEDAGYIRQEKAFIARKPRTFIIATPGGRLAFEQHKEALRQIINRGR
jgi:DNA-binding MarR family transcriptional regulator